ncbi:MAG TPA: biotin carboxylase N-terminal domain-containing protein, partial [Actinomycetota bacterium]|nr:biotin carboxylase N-terminal domain-containing protein [Actinomycetota bacterium]
ALHVDLADDAYHLGPATPSQSYLNIEKILDVAWQSQATAVHPGYGFLAENAEFARAVGDAGLDFVGPPARAMVAMGDKVTARHVAERVGAPTVPGTQDPVDAGQAIKESDRIGFPLVVKAAFGGGGKGMRLVRAPGELADAVERSAREAKAYFGRPEVYLERYIERAHHVEAQILADEHGNVSFLGERDCTLQRRYQKLVEETPSPVVDDALRARIAESALAIAKEVGYVNAGTLEFLVDQSGEFYFMEMNTRLQVEHPVTELCDGVDLVRLQLLVALGERVELSPEPRGHAIECRINAEDPFRDFLPGPGLVTGFRPPTGPFVRLDAGVTEGRRVVGDYDSLFAKLIVWGEDREIARRRMLRALDEFEVEGIPTTIPFHQWVLQTPEFRDATADTRWVERALEEGGLKPPEGEPAEIGTSPHARPPLHLNVEVDGHRVPIRVWGEDARMAPPAPPSSAGLHGGHMAGMVAAPMQGTILDVKVVAGQSVEAGDVICILEAMKMENHIAATQAGTVAEVSVQKGDVVESGQPLVVIE